MRVLFSSAKLSYLVTVTKRLLNIEGVVTTETGLVSVILWCIS